MDSSILIFVDFNNSDPGGRVRLNTTGTLNDLKTNNIKLHTGLVLNLTDQDELSTTGIVEYSEEETIWVAKIDWSSF
ncbi:hypothetical protein C8P68_105287 [Mucilaginibacter yixingensis]|uniref:Uncharacterized protein n=1 Tax=Mucilaginibacter yixingensis TaxID=1295612 RepID=A0A2T5J8I7_9SPHI|nr:hypothetical protein C8P68_105287 [Mucilaginibacter yixingensis]